MKKLFKFLKLMTVMFALLAFLCSLVVFWPMAVIWTVNTLILENITNAHLMAYTPFTKEWFAALVLSGVLLAIFLGTVTHVRENCKKVDKS